MKQFSEFILAKKQSNTTLSQWRDIYIRHMVCLTCICERSIRLLQLTAGLHNTVESALSLTHCTMMEVRALRPQERQTDHSTVEQGTRQAVSVFTYMYIQANLFILMKEFWQSLSTAK